MDAGSGADRISSDQDDATVLGGPGPDVVTADGGAIEVNGGGGRDRIRTGSFADRVTGGGGADAIDTGLGDDFVRSRDGKRDHVRCGDGQDSVDADPIDLLRGCEITEAGRAERRLRRSPAG